jgi:site-specific recombinase XerC
MPDAEALSARQLSPFSRSAGHSNISTPQRYMHLDDQELAQAQGLIN